MVGAQEEDGHLEPLQPPEQLPTSVRRAVVEQDDGVLPPGPVPPVEEEHQLQQEMVDAHKVVKSLVARKVEVPSRADATHQVDPVQPVLLPQVVLLSNSVPELRLLVCEVDDGLVDVDDLPALVEVLVNWPAAYCICILDPCTLVRSCR